jgi:hypothetical protein
VSSTEPAIEKIIANAGSKIISNRKKIPAEIPPTIHPIRGKYFVA